MRQIKDYIAIGAIAFLVIAASILTGFIVFNYAKIFMLIKKLVKVLEPFIIGFIIAYLVSPLYNLIRNYTQNMLMEQRKMEYKKAKKTAKAVAMMISMLATVLIITGLVALILPGFIDSIIKIVNSMNTYINEIVSWMNIFFDDNPEIVNAIQNYLNIGSEQFTSWLTETILPYLRNFSGSFGSVVGGIFSVAIIVINVVKNLIIGLIVAAYLLTSKTKMIAQAKKITYALFKPETGNTIINEIRYINSVFGGFIRGKLIDSLIIGIICFVFCAIVRMPYTLLVSVIVGITNIIPFFGPFIGAVPCTLLVLLVNPTKALVFIIFIIILQQIDGNIIGPRILGQSTGISAFWVLFAIVVFGNIFGITGMIIGVPVWAVIASLFEHIITKKLNRKKLSTKLPDYTHLDQVVVNEDGTYSYPKEKKQ